MSLPTTQKALVLTAAFGNFELREVPVPRPGPEEVIVKVEAAALNPVDWKIQKYGAFVDKYPAILGTDIAGEVVELGQNVSNVVVGDKVFLQGTYISRDGSAGFQQYTRADIHTLAKVPSNVTQAEAASLPVALTAAYVGLYNEYPHGVGYDNPVAPGGREKYHGKPIVVLGGSSSVGQFALQLAHASGFSPIITTASLRHSDYLKTLGATHILDRSLSDAEIQSKVKELVADPSALQVVFDSISLPDTQKLGLDLLAPGGTLAIVLPPAVEANDGKRIAGVLGLKQSPENVQLLRQLYAKLTEWLSEGILKPNRVEILSGGLNGVVEGLERLKTNKVSGVKLVVNPQDTT